MNNYHNLVVWRKADELAFQIYEATKSFPREEIYGITSQLRRSALSIPTNIAEGVGRQGRNETKHFTNIALGSLSEVEYLLRFSSRLGLLDAKEYERLLNLRKDVGGLLWLFYKSMERGSGSRT